MGHSCHAQDDAGLFTCDHLQQHLYIGQMNERQEKISKEKTHAPCQKIKFLSICILHISNK